MNTGHTLEADFEALPNSKYMKKPKIVPKRVVAHKFNKCVAAHRHSNHRRAAAYLFAPFIPISIPSIIAHP